MNHDPDTPDPRPGVGSAESEACAERRSLRPLARLDRRGFVTTALATGFAAAVYREEDADAAFARALSWLALHGVAAS